MPPAFLFLRPSLSSVRSRGMANEWLRMEEIREMELRFQG